MALENLTGTDKFIDDLTATNPVIADDVSEGDDHIRGIKNVLKNTFPNVTGAVSATHTNLDAAYNHVGNTSNPHSVTKSQVGLGSADNTSDSAKPVSTDQATAIGLKANTASPTFTGTVAGVTKSMVGLGSADNTSDSSKPVSTYQATAIGLKANLASPTFTGTVGGISKSMVGLTNVDNTADSAKPVSTYQATADGLALPKTGGVMTGTTTLKGITETEAGTANSTYTVSLVDGTIFEVTNATLCTVTVPATAAVGQSFTVISTVPAAWSGTILWSGGAAPTGGSGKSIYSFISNGSSWYGMRVGTGFA